MGGGSTKVEAPKTDISGAVADFQSAANVIRDQYPAAFEAYQSGTYDAMNAAATGFDQAGATALPFSNAARDVVSEMRSFLGMAPDAAAGGGSGAGLSSDQVQSKLENTPGYQFQFNQGQRALERSQAAQGGLLSGRAGIEAQQYGQGMAGQTYQGHLQNLLSLGNYAMPMTAFGAANKQAAGLSRAGALQTLATAKQANLQSIADAQERALTHSGAARANVAINDSNNQLQASVANSQAAQQQNNFFGGIVTSLLGGLF